MPLCNYMCTEIQVYLCEVDKRDATYHDWYKDGSVRRKLFQRCEEDNYLECYMTMQLVFGGGGGL